MQPDPRWTRGVPSGSGDEGLHETFTRVARSQPGKAALVGPHGTVAYGDLDRAADAWAARLAGAGAGPGTFVPVILPRSTELVTALLAVLKTGAAYALLDPEWPAERLRAVLDDLAPPVVVAQPNPDIGARPVWTPPDRLVPPMAGFRPRAVAGLEPACVFFTSGTTGQPKGVVSPHRATARLFPPAGSGRFTSASVVPLASATPWDAFSLELWSVLLTGGCSLIVADPYLSTSAVRAAVADHGADAVWLTSSVFNLIVDEDLAAFRGLTQVMVGGERLSAAHVRRFLHQYPDVFLLNGYGPVESTVFATTHRVTEADCDAPGGIPLGRPVPGTEVYVLNGDQQCDVGEQGEICIAGEGLALEYLNDPDLTARKFVTVTADSGEIRVYRSGDLGAWGPDGLLRFGGRADRQVKIRGHRVEPAEVEQQVERLVPGVRACRVLARRDATGAVRDLVACCLPARRGDPLADAQAVLRAHLPGYQRPAKVLSLKAFPLTPQGKLDEPALLALAEQETTDTTDAGSNDDARTPPVQPPATDPVLRAVTLAFASVLGDTSVSPDVPFVALGGDSLAAGRVCARLSARLRRRIPVAVLYDHPSAAELADWLRRTRPVDPAPAEADLPQPQSILLSSLQIGYLTHQLMAPSGRATCCLCVWQVEGHLDAAALESAIADVHWRHDALRAAYHLDPVPHAAPGGGPPPPLRTTAPAAHTEDAVRTLRAELDGGLLPEKGEVWQTALVPVTGGQTAVFGCLVHHVAFDGWSESVLAEDLAAFYNARVASRPPALARPALPAFRGRPQVPTDRHLAYLRDQLTGVPDLRWPTKPAHSRPGDLGLVTAILPPEVVAAVDALAAEAGVTRFVTLLSLWAASLAEVTGQRDFAIGVPFAQRDTPGLETAIGCHITMLCLRMRGAVLDGDLDAVRRTANIVSGAVAAQDVPFRTVLDLVSPPKAGRPPLYQVLFALQDNRAARLSLTGARTTFLRQPYPDLPLELHTELWPDDRGGLRTDIHFRLGSVDEATAGELARRFAGLARSAGALIPS